MKHKHCDLIKAWADGAQIQFRSKCSGEWQECDPYPLWEHKTEYRIKLKDIIIDEFIGIYSYMKGPKDIKRIKIIDGNEGHYIFGRVRFTLDGKTHNLIKAEVI